MGSGTKIALVTFLILMVIVVAIFVQGTGKKDSSSGPQTAAVTGAKKNTSQSSNPLASKPAVTAGNTAPTGPAVQPNAAIRASGTTVAGGPALGVAPRSPLAAGTPGGGAPGVSFVPNTTGGGSSAGGDPRPVTLPAAAPTATASPGSLVGTAPRPLSTTGAAGDSLPLSAVTGLGGAAGRSSAEVRAADSTVGVTLAPPPGPSRAAGASSPLTATPPGPRTGIGSTLSSNRPGALGSGSPGAGTGSAGLGVSPLLAGTNVPQASASSVQPVSFPIEHKVETGEGYWKIAARYWGQERAKFHNQIAAANGDKRLLAGMTVKVPAPPELPVARPATLTSPNVPPRANGANGARTAEVPAPVASDGIVSSDAKYDYYLVKKGDTLEGLARRFYGNPGKKSVIEGANPELRYATLREKAKIKLPKR